MMIAFAAAVLAAAAPALPEPPEQPGNPQPAGAVNPTRSSRAAEPAKPIGDERLLEIAREYGSWTRVSDRAQYAPTDCRANPPSGVQSSQSADPDSHGRKLYFLYAAKPEEYLSLGWSVEPATAPVGQTIVKETFTPVEVKPADIPRLAPKDGLPGMRTPAEYLVEGDRAFKAGPKRELFVMTKLDPSTPGTDRGWVYATIAADGSKVIQSGAVASCMHCHDAQRHDRQFGLPRAQELTRRLEEAEKRERAPGAPADPPAK